MTINYHLKLISAFTFLLLCLNITKAQNYMVNSGCYVSIPSGTKLHLNGSLINQNTGIFINEDSIFITGDIVQSASNNLFQPAGQGTVLLIGNDQEISGSTVAHFNNLSLQGSGVKSISNNTRVKGVLNLNDREFATGNYTLSIDNADTLAISRTTGYISSDNTGFLQRAMSQGGNYLFPTGWSNPLLKYRPVIITPPNINLDTFSVRMVDHSATIDGFDVNNKESILCLVNSGFYHHIARQPGNLGQVRLSFYFDTLIDGTFDRIAHWQGVGPQWQNTSAPSNLTYQASPQLSEISIIKWSNFIPTPFALALSSPNAAITYVHPLCQSSPAQTLTAFTPGGVWSGPGITDPVNGVFDPQQSGPGIHTIYYDITSSNGCSASDSIDITVDSHTVPGFSAMINANTVTFTNSTLNATSYYWDLGDGNFSLVKDPVHVYASTGNYTVILYATNSCGTDSSFQTVNITTTGISGDFELSKNIQVFPNPFQYSTSLLFSLKELTKVSADLYTISGLLIKPIISEKFLSEGEYSLRITADDINFVPGIYLLKIIMNDQTLIKRIVHL